MFVWNYVESWKYLICWEQVCVWVSFCAFLCVTGRFWWWWYSALFIMVRFVVMVLLMLLLLSNGVVLQLMMTLLLAWYASASGPIWQWRSQGTWLPQDYTTQDIWQIPRPACFHPQTHQQHFLQVSPSLVHKEYTLWDCWVFVSSLPPLLTLKEGSGGGRDQKLAFFLSLYGFC